VAGLRAPPPDGRLRDLQLSIFDLRLIGATSQVEDNLIMFAAFNGDQLQIAN
jgi:hypothetical protein